MSQIFRTGEAILWFPSNRVARLFHSLTEVLVSVAGRPAGMDDTGADEYEIDQEVFEAFVNELARQYLGSSHVIMRSMLEGYLATALVLVERAGGSVAALSEAIGLDPRDISVGPGGIGELGDVERLRQLAAVHAQAMSR
ncbi:hypothetical protein HDA40_002857 [Hamadaea flava]|uniref:DUF6086 family protein n=1 Tax=Hamadaea flava TaxID=1742688 RepID=A0ABV8LIF2_9ACTN|nr:DUF6086 family protein [Hamadaea flava]MCP2324350.1 hypothetical protein [Hamadaea flava]